MDFFYKKIHEVKYKLNIIINDKKKNQIKAIILCFQICEASPKWLHTQISKYARIFFC